MPIVAIILVFLSATTHTAWNLLAHSRQTISGDLFFRCHVVAGFAILLPELVAEWQGNHFPLALWGVILLSGVIHSTYYVGLMMGYRHGNFTVVYPLNQALPVLLLAGVDILRGQPPALLGWSGMVLVMVGCAIAPLQSLRQFQLSDYWNWAMVWVLVIVLTTVGFTTLDKVAVDRWLPTNVADCARYEMLQALFTAPVLWFMLQIFDKKPARPALLKDQNDAETSVKTSVKTLSMNAVHEQSGAASTTTLSSPLPSHWTVLFNQWGSSIVWSLFVFGSYWFMLLAYQFSPHVSYLTALRQISIVLGVISGVLVLREPSPKIRIGASIIITLGTLCICQAPV